MILPAVLVVLVIGGMLAGSVVSVATLAMRGSRLHEQRVLASWAIEEAVAMGLGRERLGGHGARPVGEVTVEEYRTGLGPVTIRRVRTHPLIERLLVMADGGEKELWLWWSAPAIAITEAITMVPSMEDTTGLSSQLAAIVARARIASSGGDPRSGASMTVYVGPGGDFAGRAATGFAGLAVVDEPLVIRSTAALRGLLIVRGTPRCAGGSVRIHGGLVMVGGIDRSTPPPACLTAHFDRSLVEEALALVATPQRTPFQLRHASRTGGV